MLSFAFSMVKAHGHKFPSGPNLLRAGEAIARLVDFMNRAGRCVSKEDSKYMTSCLLEHHREYLLAGGESIPKHHQMQHVTRDSWFHGNPVRYTTYEDESQNRGGKNIANKCHPRRFCWSWWERQLTLQLLPSMGRG